MANRVPPAPPMEHRGPALRQPQRPGSRPPQPPNVRPQGPPGPQGQPPPQQQLPVRPAPPISSTRYVDLTPQPQLDEETCKKKLTSYEAYSIRKVGPRDSKKDKPTWAKTEHTREAVSQEEILKQIKKLNEGESVTAKKQKLRHFQQSQVNSVLDGLKNAERNADFEWSLAQIDQKFQPVTENGKKKKETTSITVYAKRTVRSDLSAFQVYTFQERIKNERMMAAAAAARPPQQQPTEPIRVDPARVVQVPNRRGRRSHDGSSSYTDSDSESDSDSYSSSDNTTISSRSGRHSRNYHRDRRGRSHSRHRQHYRRGSYITDVPGSPGLPLHHVPYVPEPPRALVSTEEVAAAYQRGRIDADAEHLGVIDPLVRRRPLISTGVMDRLVADARYAEDRYADESRLIDEDRMRRREMELNQRVYERTRIVQPHPFAARYHDQW